MINAEPIDTLRKPETPKPGDFVRFRPSDTTLEDTSWFIRYADTGRWFKSNTEANRYLVGKIIAIKRLDYDGSVGGFYYRITSGQVGFDVSFEDVGRKILTADDY